MSSGTMVMPSSIATATRSLSSKHCIRSADMALREDGILPTALRIQSSALYDQEAAVKVPRFRIAWVMAFIALAALNFTVLRVVLDHYNPTSELVAVGAIPMANILAIGLLVGHRYRGGRPS